MAVKEKRQKVSQDPNNPKRIIVRSYPFISYYLRVGDTNGRPCAPWVREEAAMINNISRMEARDQISLTNHRHWALLNAIEKAKELALQGKLF